MCYTTNLLINGSSIFSAIHRAWNRARSYCVVFLLAYITLHFDGRHTRPPSLYRSGPHTVILYCLVLAFLFNCYATSEIVGSPGALWDLLVEASERRPIAGNASGSLLTFNSVQGGLFGLVLFGAGFAAACDSQLFQKAIAADPKYLVRGYILGGLAWFSLPFCLSTTMGLAAAGLETHPSFPTFPDLMSAEEIGAGLVLPYAASGVDGSVWCGHGVDDDFHGGYCCIFFRNYRHFRHGHPRRLQGIRQPRRQRWPLGLGVSCDGDSIRHCDCRLGYRACTCWVRRFVHHHCVGDHC
ncbi:hypothetical protein PGUG_02901 [Meyerozyma guilliermondii ATCC 6260]|uniref:Uncharacterized protein n=1 Tax=Meyerozyma guilliermondii (strain ATCC 6260 / CBS 566 / DSM 6381 / JCM 1539 / NBRC 10279 / NRRL Y-324) TaxID=294746 RepID=A5DI00_PICGU|nr:uncharacterized protein PGUG_02901 [Meyerozyma guilliermondii ATCC 6260]EDK38803.2 hypothetical protein PGUG_02901 [Meyerozyma guilliermondii ATCC 6260]